MYELKIPKDRVGCLIGNKGRIKKIIERSTNTKIKVSKVGDVEISGEGYGGYVCERIVRAIGRGFNPNIALDLMNEEYGLEILDLKNYSGKSKNKFLRIKSRLIGKEGKARKVIEKLTGCHISVYGKTISIIGEFEKLSITLKGVEKLIHGSEHGNVFGYLEREMKKLRGK